MIISFTSNLTNAQPNTSITLSWEAVGDVARIDQTTPSGQVTATYDVGVSGQLVVTVPANPDGQVIYRLVVVRGQLSAARSVPIITPVVPQCPTPWFFGAPPQGTACPSGASFNVPGKIQAFQNGVMFTLNIGGTQRLYGLVYSDRRYSVNSNITWDGTTTYTTPCGTAPAGLSNPQDVFNWAYHNTSGPSGQWCSAIGGIGWATTAPNLSASFQAQFEQVGTAIFINLPGIGVVRLPSTTQGGDWTSLN